MAKTIMLQGTSSNVGKSIITTALCRILLQEGYVVAPFKAQNIALNSFVTHLGEEMGMAQAVQAEACKICPRVIMNPILLKPTLDSSTQVIVMGKPEDNLLSNGNYNNYKNKAWKIITESLNKLMTEFDILVIEGAGSPAEVNLKANDLVNMRVAKEVQAPVLLVADIDRGGVLASIVGTLELLEPDEKELIKGFIINKFSGDINLLKPAIDFLEEKTGKPVVGVIPYINDINIPEEDSVTVEKVNTSNKIEKKLDIAIIYLPHLSNFTDFDSLRDEIDVEIRYIKNKESFGTPDLIIIPGSKNTISDLIFLKKSGLDIKIKEAVSKRNIPVVGICGGYQILGEKLYDPYHVESNIEEINGLGLLKIKTEFSTNKTTTQIKGKVLSNKGLLEGCKGSTIEGYEIHMGVTTKTNSINPIKLTKRFGRKVEIPEGSLDFEGKVFGTYIHGIFDNDFFRRKLLNNLRKSKGWETIEKPTSITKTLRDEAINRLANTVRNNINIKLLKNIVGIEG